MVVMALVLPALMVAPETLATTSTGALRRSLPYLRRPRFRAGAVPMAVWVFVAPAVAFALLPSIVGAEGATDGIALTAFITTLTAIAGVAVQPLARRLDTGPGSTRTATVGLMVMVGGLVLAAVTAHEQQAWMLVPSAIVFGCAYGLCLVAGLVEVQRLAPPVALAGLTAIFYAIAYLGFALPFVLALAANAASYAWLLAITAALALATMGYVPLGASDRPDR
jgi:hypothetical protein